MDNVTNWNPGRTLYLQFLQAAWKTTSPTVSWTCYGQNFTTKIVMDVDIKRPKRSIKLHGKEIAIILSGHKNLLTHAVFDDVAVTHLPSDDHFGNVDFLVDQDLVDLCEVLQSRRAARDGRAWRWHGAGGRRGNVVIRRWRTRWSDAGVRTRVNCVGPVLHPDVIWSIVGWDCHNLEDIRQRV